MSVLSTCNCSTVLFLLGIAYLYFTFQRIYELMNPLHDVIVAEGDATVDPLWKRNTPIKMVCYLSSSSKFAPINIADLQEKAKVVINYDNLTFSPTQSEFILTANIVRPSATGSLSAPSMLSSTDYNVTVEASSRIWSALTTNKTSVFLHVLIVPRTSQHDTITRDMLREGAALFGAVELVKYDRIPKHFSHRYLLSDYGWVAIDPEDTIRNRFSSDAVISYWKPEVAVRLVTDFSRYPYSHLSPAIVKNMLPRQGKDQQQYYKPPIHVDEIGLTSDKYIPLNDTVRQLPLRISYAPMELQRWMLMSNMETALESQSGMGFGEKDIDDVRRLISDTSVYLLAVTVVASMLHLLFEFLAFQSDINFWQTNESLAGLSTRSVITDLFSQFIVFLYLVDKEASLVVTIPAFAGILIQVWKVKKATGVALEWTSAGGILPTLVFRRWQRQQRPEPDASSSSSIEASPDDILTKATLDADRIATSYLSMILLPMALGFIAHSLIYEKHPSWYSWAIGSVTGVVYTFGFILMCPQLFINHQLKSVSHLPWKFLVYRFLNTFIDDLFAFVIKMPTMHRLSVFRDDVVFLIYLYQRWIYTVDKSRPIEK